MGHNWMIQIRFWLVPKGASPKSLEQKNVKTKQDTERSRLHVFHCEDLRNL